MYVYIYVYIYIYTYIHTYTHTHIHIPIMLGHPGGGFEQLGRGLAVAGAPQALLGIHYREV